MMFTYDPGELEPGDAAGHQDIGKYKIICIRGLELLESLRSVQGDFHVVTELLEVRRGDRRDLLVIFHQQHSAVI